MNAIDVLSHAQAAGVHIAAEGENLVLEADDAPPANIIELLARNKRAVLTLLRQGSAGWSASRWKTFFDERAAIAEHDGGLARDEAEARAFEACVAEWITRQHAPTAPGRCALCRGPDTREARVVPFGTATVGHAWLHPNCWPAWSGALRREAVEALKDMGIAHDERFR